MQIGVESTRAYRNYQRLSPLSTCPGVRSSIFRPRAPNKSAGPSGPRQHHCRQRRTRAAVSLRRVAEIAHIRWLLAFLARHQMAFRAEEVALAADLDMAIALRAVFLRPGHYLFRVAAIAFRNRPRPRQ